MIKKIGLIFYTLLAVLILASCSNKKKEEEKAVLAEWRKDPSVWGI